ncbi:hypothetical protein P4546_32710, partial [Bacillus thuringiensis]
QCAHLIEVCDSYGVVVAKTNVVSTFLAKRIQMNFAENKSWPTSAVWQKCPTQVLAGSMRRRKKKPSRVNQLGVGAIPTADLLYVPYLIDNPYATLQAGFEAILVCLGRCSGRRLSRNRSLRLHGVLNMHGSAMGSRHLTLTYGFCG